MSIYDSLIRPLLFSLPAEPAHHAGLKALELAEIAPGLAKLIRHRVVKADRPALAATIAGLRFPNCIGLAAGLDKNAEALTGLFSLGFGAVEIGTVTPRAQPGNEAPRIFRLPEHQALINRLGFNNKGMQAAASQLSEQTWRPAPIGVNIGKNKDTPNENAVDDYLLCAEKLGPLGDYVVVNLSSPNTPGLRQLQEPKALEALLRSVRKTVSKPLFLKIAPDLADEGIDAAVDVARECGIDGLICTNTTIARPFEHPLAKEAGGLSGKPLTARANEVTRRAFRHAKGALPIIGVGGIFTANDVWERTRAGASFVQVYTGFIYGGPMLPKQLLDGVEALLRETRHATIAHLVGSDAQ